MPLEFLCPLPSYHCLWESPLPAGFPIKGRWPFVHRLKSVARCLVKLLDSDKEGCSRGDADGRDHARSPSPCWLLPAGELRHCFSRALPSAPLRQTDLPQKQRRTESGCINPNKCGKMSRVRRKSDNSCCAVNLWNAACSNLEAQEPDFYSKCSFSFLQ